MKKLMIAAAIVLAAVVSQAAATKWSVDDMLIPVADDPKVNQSGITTSWEAGDTPFAAGALAIQLFYNDGSDWQSLGSFTLDGEGSIAADTLWSQTKTKEICDAIGSKKVQFNIEATYETADGVYTYSQSPLEKDLTKVYNGQSNVTAGFSAYDGSWDYVAKSTPTPEPTSGLLLLLGVAGLALKRKRA